MDRNPFESGGGGDMGSDAEPMLSAGDSGAASGPLDRKAIEALISKHYVGLRILLTRRAGDPAVAADLLNEAICTSWEKWQAGQIARPEQIAGYIFQVAMNLLRNYRRGAAVRPDKRGDPRVLETLPAESSSEQAWAEKKITLQVRKMIEELRAPRDRMILTRFYLDEADKPTICRELGLDSEQFDKVLHRARGRLRQQFESSGMSKADLL